MLSRFRFRLVCAAIRVSVRFLFYTTAITRGFNHKTSERVFYTLPAQNIIYTRRDLIELGGLVRPARRQKSETIIIIIITSVFVRAARSDIRRETVVRKTHPTARHLRRRKAYRSITFLRFISVRRTRRLPCHIFALESERYAACTRSTIVISKLLANHAHENNRIF